MSDPGEPPNPFGRGSVAQGCDFLSMPNCVHSASSPLRIVRLEGAAG